MKAQVILKKKRYDITGSFPALCRVLAAIKCKITGDDQKGWDLETLDGEMVAEGFLTREAADAFKKQVENYRLVPEQMGPMNEVLLEDEDESKKSKGAAKQNLVPVEQVMEEVRQKARELFPKDLIQTANELEKIIIRSLAQGAHKKLCDVYYMDAGVLVVPAVGLHDGVVCNISAYDGRVPTVWKGIVAKIVNGLAYLAPLVDFWATTSATSFQPPTKAQIVEVLRKHPLIKLKEKVKRAFLVGSFASGKNHDESDVDILLEVEPHPDQSAAQLAEAYRRPLQQYFVTHNIRGKDDSVHPQWAGRRVDLYFTYDADQEDGRPKQELASLKEGNLMVLNKSKYPAIARVLAANESLSVPIDIEGPRKNHGRAKEVAEKIIDDLKVKVRKDLEDFAKDYMQVDFHKANDKEGRDKNEYRFDSDRKKEVHRVYKLAIDQDKGKPSQPGNPKGHDEGSVTLYSKNKTLAPGIDHETGGDGEKAGYDRNKAIWVRIGFSWEETADPEAPKVFWWEGTPSIIKDPEKEQYLVKRKHEYKDYAEIEKYMSTRLNTDEIIRDTSEQHLAGIKAKIVPLVEQARNILKPLDGKTLKFANFPKPITLKLTEQESIKGNDEDQHVYFKIVADPNKSGYEPFNVLRCSLNFSGGEFHTPYDFKDFGQYFSSDFDLKTIDENDDDVYSPVAKPDFSRLTELMKEVTTAMKRKVPVLEVDEDQVEQEPKQLEAPEEESA